MKEAQNSEANRTSMKCKSGSLILLSFTHSPLYSNRAPIDDICTNHKHKHIYTLASAYCVPEMKIGCPCK